MIVLPIEYVQSFIQESFTQRWYKSVSCCVPAVELIIISFDNKMVADDDITPSLLVGDPKYVVSFRQK